MEPISSIKPKGILKKPTTTPEKNAPHLRWDEDNIRITEAQKDAKMKVDEPPTPYIRYNPELDADLQEMEDLKLIPNSGSGPGSCSSRSSSVSSSPKHAQIAAPPDWTSGSEDEEDEEAKARHERFKQMRARHYHSEGKYVHQGAVDFPDSDESLTSDNNDDDDDDDDDDVAGTNGRSGHDNSFRRQPYSSPMASARSDGIAIEATNGSGSENGDDALPSSYDRKHVSRSFTETYGDEDGDEDMAFEGNVDEINASNMEM